MSERSERQLQVFKWVRRCFGESTLNGDERVLRFLEEAVELAQAQGISQEMATKTLEYVYAKPKGDPHQEIGGVCVTLLAYCACAGYDLEEAETTEINRVLAIDPEYFRKRHNIKASAGIAKFAEGPK